MPAYPILSYHVAWNKGIILFDLIFSINTQKTENTTKGQQCYNTVIGECTSSGKRIWNAVYKFGCHIS